ncbi:MAG: hydroxyacid dehydrogenase [Candidatus Doudnabacteria bacterium]|nr:hydroxyacid dehydrogenase [Candidatus Doudnabacteria bacterium]
MKITLLGLNGWQKEYLQSSLSEHELFFANNLTDALPQETKILCVFVHDKVSADLLKKLPELKLVAAMSTGFDNIDLKACQEKGITVCNVPSYGENTVAEFAFGLILSVYKNIYKSIQRVKQEGRFSVEGLMGLDLKGKTLGVVGAGRIGRHLIKMALGFDMQVLAYDPHPPVGLDSTLGFKFVTLEELLKNSDIVSLHVPYMPVTHHLLDEAKIGLMKNGAVLINTSRGGLVDTFALLNALKSGKLLGVGLDVLEEEGHILDETLLLKGHPSEKELKTILADMELMHLENVIVTPHTAFNTKEAIERILQTTVENIRAFEQNSPKNLVNMG